MFVSCRRLSPELLLHINSSFALQAKAKILVVRDVERDDIEFISRTLGCLPIAHVDHMRPEKLGHAKLVEEETVRLPLLSQN